jgi:hypothetical protein
VFVDPATPKDVTALSPSLFGASGAILSNAPDVADFYRSLLGGRLLTPAALRAMRTIDPVATGGVPDSGILGGGWASDSCVRNSRAAWHGATTPRIRAT